MANRSDQIQAEIAQTRARLATNLDRVGSSQQAGSGDLISTITEQIRQRPLAAIGLSLLAGSLLQNSLSGGQGGTGSSAPSSTSRYTGYTPGTAGTQYRTGGSIGQGVSSAADRAGDALQSAGQTASDTAQQVVDTTSDVARQVADRAGDAANQVVETAGAAAEQVSEQVTDLTAAISEQIRRRPLVAVGLSLAAGSLLQNALSGGQGGGGGSSAALRRPGYTGYATGSTYGTGYRTGTDLSGSTYGATGTRYGTTGTTYSTGQRAADTATGAVQQVADTTRDVAETVVDTTTDVARQVADRTGDAVNQAVETAGTAVAQVSERVDNLGDTLSQQIQQRPLTALGVAIAAGMFLQPTLTPHVSNLTQSIRRPVSSLGNAIALDVSAAQQDELDRIRRAFVPATVERARQYTSRDLRESLDRSLEGIVGQSSLRAGVVAAVTERAEGLVENRLPGVLERNLQGTGGLLALALTAAVLRARDQARQGQGQTFNVLETNLVQSLTETAREQLQRYFPEFRQQYEAAANDGPGQQAQAIAEVRNCSNCGAELPATARFCPSCGTPVPA